MPTIPTIERRDHDRIPHEDADNFYMRLREVEKEMAQVVVMLNTQQELLKQINDKVNAPVNLPAWLSALVGVIVVFGGLLYTAFIAPLDARVENLEEDIRVIRMSGAAGVRESKE